MIKKEDEIITLDNNIADREFVQINKETHFVKKLEIHKALSEVLGSNIAKDMYDDTVSYKLAKNDHSFYTVSKSFLKPNQEYVPFSEYLDTMNNLYLAEQTNKTKNIFLIKQCLGKENFNKYIKILISDLFIFNQDRHFDNFGFRKDKEKTIEISKDLSPNFDFDNSLLTAFTFKNYNELDNMSNYHLKRYIQNAYAVTSRPMCKYTAINEDLTNKSTPVSKLIDLCLMEDMANSNNDHYDLIVKGLDIIDIQKSFEKVEDENGFEINQSTKNVYQCLFDLRKKEIDDSLKNSSYKIYK